MENMHEKMRKADDKEFNMIEHAMKMKVAHARGSFHKQQHIGIIPAITLFILLSPPLNAISRKSTVVLI